MFNENLKYMSLQARYVQTGDSLQNLGVIEAVQDAGIFRTFYGAEGSFIRVTVFDFVNVK